MFIYWVGEKQEHWMRPGCTEAGRIYFTRFISFIMRTSSVKSYCNWTWESDSVFCESLLMWVLFLFLCVNVLNVVGQRLGKELLYLKWRVLKVFLQRSLRVNFQLVQYCTNWKTLFSPFLGTESCMNWNTSIFISCTVPLLQIFLHQMCICLR